LFYDASISVKYEGFQIVVCSNTPTTEGEFYVGYNEEELWHADFDQKTGDMTTPNFTGPMASFDKFYEDGVLFLAVCKRDILRFIEGFKSPPLEMGKTCKFCTFE